MIFNLTSVVYWRVVSYAKKRQVDIDNVQENARQVTHDYTIGDQFYVEMNNIYHNLIIRNGYRIELMKYLQKVQFESNGKSKRTNKYKTVKDSL